MTIENKIDWVTNDPRVATQLKAIESVYQRKLRECRLWPVGEKGPYISRARRERQEAIDRLAARLRAEP